MSAIAAPPPIPGEPLDPPPKAPPDIVADLEDGDGAATAAVGVGYRAMTRFTHARATLLAAGTTYYTFLAMFSLIALAYGVTTLVDATRVASYVTQAISEAFPGLLGEDGIDPAELRAVGQAASVVGLVAMLYAGGGAMAAASGSIHEIYGAPVDPRNYVVKRARLLAWLVVVGTLIALSLVVGTALVGFSTRVMDAWGIEGTESRAGVRIGAALATIAVDYLVMRLLLGRLGGIRPPARALTVGALTGAVAVGVLRVPMALILEFSLDKPQYGALAIPIGVLLVLYLNSMAVYGAAAVAAGYAEKHIPLDELEPGVDVRTAQLDAAGPGDEGDDDGRDGSGGHSLDGGDERESVGVDGEEARGSP